MPKLKDEGLFVNIITEWEPIVQYGFVNFGWINVYAFLVVSPTYTVLAWLVSLVHVVPAG